jgi:mono/diheme cytochrome c family protein
VLALAAGCRKQPRFTEPLKLAGGKEIPAATLNEGHDAYMLYCYACHGEKGDGRGPASAGMRPAPRDFTQALFKFGGVEVGQLPNDDDLAALVKHGLAGTPMLPWDISEGERGAIIQYLKTFSPRWTQEAPGDRIVPTPDPWVGREAAAIELGKRIYHLSGVEKDAQGNMKYVLAGCSSCHPAYVTRDELVALSTKYLGAPPAAISDDLYRPSLKPSEYKAGDQTLQILPPDFLFHQVKNGTTLPELYRTIASGVAGAAMPTWKNVLNEEGLWALVHYVKSLIDRRGTPEALALRRALMTQAAR